MIKITFVRHGETLWNKLGKINGRTDISLSEKGKKQAEKIAEKLKNRNFDFIIISPLKRATETGDIILKKLKTPLMKIIDKDFIERDFGIFEGKNLLSSLKNKNDLLKFRLETPKNGESIEMLEFRIKKALENYKDKKILLISHGYVGMIIKKLSENISIKKAILFDFPNAEPIEFVY